MKKLLSLCVVMVLMVLGFGSVAIAGGISAADAQYLFGNDQIVAATISDLEMEQTQGQLAIIIPPVPFTLPTDLSIGVDLIEDPPVLGAAVKDGLLDLGVVANLIEDSVLGATVEEGALAGGIAAPLMGLMQLMPSSFDPSMLTDLLGGAGGLPLDITMLTDLLGGGLATPLMPLVQASPINNVNDLTDLINGLGLINLELFKGSDIIDLDIIPLDPNMLNDLLGGAGGVPTFDPSILTDLLSGSGLPLDTSMLTDLLGGSAGEMPLDPSMLTNLLGGAGGTTFDPAMFSDLLTSHSEAFTELLTSHADALTSMMGEAGGTTFDPNMLTDLLNSHSEAFTELLTIHTDALTSMLGGAGGVPTLDPSMLTDLLGSLSNSSPLDPNMLNNLLGMLPLEMTGALPPLDVTGLLPL